MDEGYVRTDVDRLMMMMFIRKEKFPIHFIKIKMNQTFIQTKLSASEFETNLSTKHN